MKTDYFAQRYQTLKNAGLCTDCGKVPSIKNKTRCAECRDKTAEGDRKRTREQMARLKSAGLCTGCGQPRDGEGLKCQKCVQDQSIRSKRHNLKLRNEVFEAYGGYRCVCCEELKDPEFMQLDHINNDGAAHRKKLAGKGPSTTYRWLKKNGFPKIVQPMCADCNAAKGFYGACPHQRKKHKMLQYLAKVPLTY